MTFEAGHGRCIHWHIYLAGFSITLSPNGQDFLRATEVFFQSISKVAIVKTKNATFSSLFLFLLSFSFLTVIFELLRFKTRKPTF